MKFVVPETREQQITQISRIQKSSFPNHPCHPRDPWLKKNLWSDARFGDGFLHFTEAGFGDLEGVLFPVGFVKNLQ